jgi:hypothetical protein
VIPVQAIRDSLGVRNARESQRYGGALHYLKPVAELGMATAKGAGGLW